MVSTPVFFRAPGVAISFLGLWGINVFVFKWFRINYLGALNLNSDDLLQPSQIFKTVFFLGSFLLFCSLGYLITDATFSSLVVPEFFPILFYFGVLFICIAPIDRFYYRQRVAFFNILKRVVQAKAPISFAEVLVADGLTSLGKALGDMEVAICLFLSLVSFSGSQSPQSQLVESYLPGCIHSLVIPAIISIPFILRFRQCLASRRYIIDLDRDNAILNSSTTTSTATTSATTNAAAAATILNNNTISTPVAAAAASTTSTPSTTASATTMENITNKPNGDIVLDGLEKPLSTVDNDKNNHNNSNNNSNNNNNNNSINNINNSNNLNSIALSHSHWFDNIPFLNSLSRIPVDAAIQTLNSCKYASALPVIWFSAMKRSYPHSEWLHLYKSLWLLSVSVNSLFGFVWDVRMDWGLAQSNVTHPFLRSHILYHPAVYYIAVVLNFALRVTWSLKLSSHLHLTGEWYIFMFEMFEICRRFLWIFIRVEWECVKRMNTSGSYTHLPRKSDAIKE